MTQSILIGIAGGSASGKTTVARTIARLLGEARCALLEMDSYYKDLSHLTPQEREKVNFDHPGAMDLGLFKEHLKKLKSGHVIDKPLYNFHTHALEARTVKFGPKRIVLVDGLFVLHEGLRDQFDLRIYVDTPEKIRLERRLKRDINERGRKKEDVIRQYHATVKPMHDEHVIPSAVHADVVISWEAEDLEALKEIVKKIKKMDTGRD